MKWKTEILFSWWTRTKTRRGLSDTRKGRDQRAEALPERLTGAEGQLSSDRPLSATRKGNGVEVRRPSAKTRLMQTVGTRRGIRVLTPPRPPFFLRTRSSDTQLQGHSHTTKHAIRTAHTTTVSSLSSDLSVVMQLHFPLKYCSSPLENSNELA